MFVDRTRQCALLRQRRLPSRDSIASCCCQLQPQLAGLQPRLWCQSISKTHAMVLPQTRLRAELRAALAREVACGDGARIAAIGAAMNANARADGAAMQAVRYRPRPSDTREMECDGRPAPF
jgi:hypothetical protein